MRPDDISDLQHEAGIERELLQSFWKIHILHHAEKHPFYGLWMLEELHEHGHKLSPGTLYPVLQRMERNGWLKSQAGKGVKSRRLYQISPKGKSVLKKMRAYVAELHREVAAPRKKPASARR